MKLIALITALAVALTAAFTGVAGASHGADDPVGHDNPAPQTAPTTTAPARQFEGRVVSINREAKRFRLNDAERGIVRIHVTPNTRFERIDGFAGLRVGMRGVEASVRRDDGIWKAVSVERSGGGGQHGGDDS